MPTLALTGGVQRAENPNQTIELFQYGPSLAVASDSSDFITLSPEASYEVPMMGLPSLSVVIMYSSIPLDVQVSVGEGSATMQTRYLVLFESNITGITLTNTSTTVDATVRIIIGGSPE